MGDLSIMDKIYPNSNLKLVTGAEIPESLETQEWQEIRRNRLINSLNKINFRNGEVVLNFRHLEYDTLVSVCAKPQPCLDENLKCLWSDSFYIDNKIHLYGFENFFFTDGLKQVLVAAEVISIDQNGVSFCLPENAVVINTRKVKRHKCTNVSAWIIQNGLYFEGELETYNPVSFSVNIPDDRAFNYHQEIMRDDPAEIILSKDNEKLFTGKCEIFRQTDVAKGRILIVKPLKIHIQRFKSKKFRNIRQELNPSPKISFSHPLIGKRVNLRINDISGSGFSVEESYKNSLLLPGLIIPELKIVLTNGLELQCKTQVIYRTTLGGENVKCGFAFIDMNIKDQIRLTSFLIQAYNKNAYVSTKIDVDDLWDFFFETGFIYPEKYYYIHANKKRFIEVYKKLYEQDSDIAINFTYQDKGIIYGHLSMFRFYDKTWIIHHHAAKSAKRSTAGLVVLEQIGRYINGFHRLPSTHMEYVGCYFRPDNKFPNLVFGGAARKISEGCSLDEFAYVHLNKNNLNSNLSTPWTIHPSTESELAELTNFYDSTYGGLTLKALDISSFGSDTDQNINDIYHSNGFKRQRCFYSLKKKEQLTAVFMICVTELGLNLSDLTNSIHVFIINSKNLPDNILYSVISRLAEHYDHDNLSVLIFPKKYCVEKEISFSKIYNFWVLDLEKGGDDYINHIERLTRRIKKPTD
ncbi:MAG: PilZ domain-containing protein [Deltaproteobacteria bacterium]|jgi:hypothetical protein|nr:PilZ domain-containing protein [Deltaproteobacteria bacterium]